MLKQRAQTTKPKLENHKELPMHTCKLPLNQCNSSWTNACKPIDENRAAASAQLRPVRPVTTTGQTDVQHVNRACPPIGQTGYTQSPKMARNHLKTFQMHSVDQNMLKLLPLVDNA
jgi:hypothetical protein